MEKSKTAEVFAWTKSGPVYSPASLDDVNNIDLLKTACRTKHLFLADKPQLLRSTYSFFLVKRIELITELEKQLSYQQILFDKSLGKLNIYICLLTIQR